MSAVQPSYRVLHPRHLLGWVEKVWDTGNAHVKFDDAGVQYVKQSDLKLVVEETTYSRSGRDRSEDHG